MIWASCRFYTVGLIVRDGIIVEAPPIVRKWALGHSAREIWDKLKSYGATVRWIP